MRRGEAINHISHDRSSLKSRRAKCHAEVAVCVGHLEHVQPAAVCWGLLTLATDAVWTERAECCRVFGTEVAFRPRQPSQFSLLCLARGCLSSCTCPVHDDLDIVTHSLVCTHTHTHTHTRTHAHTRAHTRASVHTHTRTHAHTHTHTHTHTRTPVSYTHLTLPTRSLV